MTADTQLPFDESAPVVRLRFRPRRDQPGCSQIPDIPRVVLPDVAGLGAAIKAHVDATWGTGDFDSRSGPLGPVKVAVNRPFGGGWLVAYVSTGDAGNIGCYVVETEPVELAAEVRRTGGAT